MARKQDATPADAPPEDAALIQKVDTMMSNEPVETETKTEPETVPPADGEVPEPAINLDDSATDQAVSDIVANEGDTILALEDLKTQRQATEAANDQPRAITAKGVFYLLVLAVVIAAVLIGYGYTRM